MTSQPGCSVFSSSNGRLALNLTTLWESWESPELWLYSDLPEACTCACLDKQRCQRLGTASVVCIEVCISVNKVCTHGWWSLEASKPRSLEDVEVDNPAHFHQLLQSLPTQVRGGEYVLGICFVLHGDKQYIRRHSTTFLHGFEIVFHQLKFQWVYHFLEDWTSKTLLVHSTNSQRQCCPPSGPEDIEKDPTPPCGISCISCPFGTKLLKFAQGMYCLWNHCAAKGRNCEALRLFVLSWFVSAWNHFELQPTCKDMKGLSALATEQAVAMLPDTKRCSSNSF